MDSRDVERLMAGFRDQAQLGIEFRGEGWADIDSVKALVWDLNSWLRGALEDSSVSAPEEPGDG